MDQHTQHNRSVRAVTALLIVVMAIPLISQLFMSHTGTETAELVTMFNEDIEAIRQNALQDRDRIRAQRRAYSRAVERCRDRLAKGEQVTCPDINDFSGYDVEALHKAADEQVREPTSKYVPITDKAKRYSERTLSIEDRKTLRTYVRAGFCSRVAGVMLYKMCLELLGDSASSSNPTGYKNNYSSIAEPKVTTINDYLKVLDESITNRTQKTVRPTGYSE